MPRRTTPQAEQDRAAAFESAEEAGTFVQLFDAYQCLYGPAHAGGDEVLRLAQGRLDPEAHAYLRLRRQGEPVFAIAAALGVSEASLRNRYGGGKLVRRVRAEVRRLVLGLSEWHRRLLARHLLEGAGLSP